VLDPRDAGGVGVVARSLLQVADEAAEAAAEPGPVSLLGAESAVSGRPPLTIYLPAATTRRLNASILPILPHSRV
jgi:hypothetical protein